LAIVCRSRPLVHPVLSCFDSGRSASCGTAGGPDVPVAAPIRRRQPEPSMAMRSAPKC